MNHKKVPLLIGAGISTEAAARLLHQMDQEFHVTNDQPLTPKQRVQFAKFGGKYIKPTKIQVQRYDYIVTSPGVPRTHPVVAAAYEAGLSVITEIDLGLSQFKHDPIVVGITGTNGKSTVCDMIHHIAKDRLRSVAAGNIGLPVCEAALMNPQPQFISLELSSYQLEYLTYSRLDGVVFTSITEDHLARHKSMPGYISAKLRIFDRLKPESPVVTTPSVIQTIEEWGLKVPYDEFDTSYVTHDSNFDPKLADQKHFLIRQDHLQITSNLKLPLRLDHITGRHNITNAAMAFVVCHKIFNHPKDILESLQTYKPLPYRSQIIQRSKNTVIINDSKSTNIASTLALIEGQDAPFILMLGGQPKGESFGPIKKYRANITKIIGFGAAAERIMSELGDEIPTSTHTTLSEALDALRKQFKLDPRNILFSPGCASFDEFQNFNVRGEYFSNYIKLNFSN